MSLSPNPPPANGSEARTSQLRQAEKRIGEMLVEAGVISETQLEEALDRHREMGSKTVTSLIELGHMDGAQFVDFLARQRGIPSISLKNYRVSQELIELIPRDFVVHHEVFPIDKLGRLLTVGMVCPLDNAAIRELEQLTGLRIKPMLCTHREIREAISRYYLGNEYDLDDRHQFSPRYTL